MNESIERALSAENGTAEVLIRAAQQLIRLQTAIQPDALAALATATHDAAEIRVEITLGPWPMIRAVTIDDEGEEACLIRRLELQPVEKH